MTKRCARCNEEKAVDAFSRNRKNRDGRQYECKPCRVAMTREARLNDPEKAKRWGGGPGVSHGAVAPERARAWRAVAKAIRNGVLKRPSTCGRCGSGRFAIQAHHSDYARPLDVEWLCASCHRYEHSTGEVAC